MASSSFPGNRSRQRWASRAAVLAAMVVPLVIATTATAATATPAKTLVQQEQSSIPPVTLTPMVAHQCGLPPLKTEQNSAAASATIPVEAAAIATTQDLAPPAGSQTRVVAGLCLDPINDSPQAAQKRRIEVREDTLAINDERRSAEGQLSDANQHNNDLERRTARARLAKVGDDSRLTELKSRLTDQALDRAAFLFPDPQTHQPLEPGTGRVDRMATPDQVEDWVRRSLNQVVDPAGHHRDLTSNLDQAVRQNKVFANSPALVNKLRVGAAGVAAPLYIAGVVEAFTQDTATVLDKAAAVTAPIPLVGQALGIADAIATGNTEGLIVNVASLGGLAVGMLIPGVGLLVDVALLTYVLARLIIQAVNPPVLRPPDPALDTLYKIRARCWGYFKLLADREVETDIAPRLTYLGDNLHRRFQLNLVNSLEVAEAELDQQIPQLVAGRPAKDIVLAARELVQDKNKMRTTASQELNAGSELLERSTINTIVNQVVQGSDKASLDFCDGYLDRYVDQFPQWKPDQERMRQELHRIRPGALVPQLVCSWVVKTMLDKTPAAFEPMEVPDTSLLPRGLVNMLPPGQQIEQFDNLAPQAEWPPDYPQLLNTFCRNRSGEPTGDLSDSEADPGLTPAEQATFDDILPANGPPPAQLVRTVSDRVNPPPPLLPAPVAGRPAVTVVISTDKFPEAAQHIQDAIEKGYPDVVTIDRAGAKARRADIEGLKKSYRAQYTAQTRTAAFDADEWPMAMMRQGGYWSHPNVTTQPNVGPSWQGMDKSNNSSLGSTTKAAFDATKANPWKLRYNDGTDVRFIVVDNKDLAIDIYKATKDNRPNDLRRLIDTFARSPGGVGKRHTIASLNALHTQLITQPQNAARLTFPILPGAKNGARSCRPWPQ